MEVISKYWKILRINPGSEGVGYKKEPLPLACDFFRTEFPEVIEPARRSQSLIQQHHSIQTALYSKFITNKSCDDIRTIANAGLCLRSYISYSIVAACKILASRFAATGQLTYRDLLPYVLNDDGGMQVVLGQDGEQLVLHRNGKLEKTEYQLFSVEMLRKFNPSAGRISSLDNWVHLQIRQNKDLKNFLVERGFVISSDWALLNRAGPNQLDSLSDRERKIIIAFHSVYRRDRRRQQRAPQKCPPPSLEQLQEMQQFLREQEITFSLPEQLETELKRLGQILRQYALWSMNGMPQSESLEEVDSSASEQTELFDPNSNNDLEQMAQQELREFCYQLLIKCLDLGIEQSVNEHINSLSQRPRYAMFASKVKVILKLVYCQRQSQSKIAEELGMTNQSQVSRVLNPTTLLKRVRYWTIEHFFQALLSKVSSLKLATLSTDLDYLKNLMQHIEAFVDAEVFQAAVTEIKTAKNRSMNSLYAQRLRHYIEKSECDLNLHTLKR